MIVSNLFILVIIFVYFNCDCAQILNRNNRFRRLPMAMQSALKLKQRLQEKIDQYRQRSTKTICYDHFLEESIFADTVGCFDLPHKRSPLQKIPEDPEMLNTKFYLFRRNMNFSHPEMLYYDDEGKSLEKSHFNYSQPLKMVVHGYLSKWNSMGNLIGMSAYLKIYDCNVVLMDWEIGARGPHYATAAANTELVGRQLGILLLNMIEKGLDPKNIHLIGFSLGAHVAGSSSEVLKQKGHLIGRITGLDAASPLFRSNHLREKHKKLDKSDAHFVDVVHTDASPFITDGFGLWQPVGHVDFFPNGGQEQPGCVDTKQSVVVTHFDRSLTREIACSHLRAWQLFQETLLNKATNKSRCEFIAFSCPAGLPSFERGRCFPQLDKPNSSLALDPIYRNEIGRLGEDGKGEGVMYFATRASPPYCGTQLQASIQVSQKTGPVRGFFNLQLTYLTYSVDFLIYCQITDFIMTGTVMSSLGVADHNSLINVHTINATLYFTPMEMDEETDTNITHTPIFIFIDKISILDMYGDSWQFCGKDTVLKNSNGLQYDKISMTLKNKICY